MPAQRFHHAASADEYEAALEARKYLILGFKWALGLVILALILHSVKMANVFAAMAGTDLRLVNVGLVLALLGRILLAWQTTIVVAIPSVPLTLARAFSVNLTTGFYSLMLPGDLSTGAVRWYKLSRATGQRAEVLAAIVFQRLVNTFCILLFGLLGLLIEFPLEQGHMLFVVALLLAGVVTVLAFICSKRRSRGFESLRALIWQWIPYGLGARVEKVWAAVISYRRISRSQLMLIFMLAVGDTFVNILLFKTTAAAMNLIIPLAAIIWIRSMVLLIQLIPASVSGLGLREGALVAIMPYYGVAPADALSFSLIIFGYTLFFSALGGMLEAWKSLRPME